MGTYRSWKANSQVVNKSVSKLSLLVFFVEIEGEDLLEHGQTSLFIIL